MLFILIIFTTNFVLIYNRFNHLVRAFIYRMGKRGKRGKVFWNNNDNKIILSWCHCSIFGATAVVINGGNDRFQQRLQQETSLNIYIVSCHHLFEQKYCSNFEINYRIFYKSMMNKIVKWLFSPDNHIHINKNIILFLFYTRIGRILYYLTLL